MKVAAQVFFVIRLSALLPVERAGAESPRRRRRRRRGAIVTAAIK
jgi:hypothetical protein